MGFSDPCRVCSCISYTHPCISCLYPGLFFFSPLSSFLWTAGSQAFLELFFSAWANFCVRLSSSACSRGRHPHESSEEWNERNGSLCGFFPLPWRDLCSFVVCVPPISHERALTYSTCSCMYIDSAFKVPVQSMPTKVEERVFWSNLALCGFSVLWVCLGGLPPVFPYIPDYRSHHLHVCEQSQCRFRKLAVSYYSSRI